MPLPLPTEEPRTRGRYLSVVARLKPGASLEQARAELKAIAARYEIESPRYNKGYTTEVIPLREQFVGNARHALLILAGFYAVMDMAGWQWWAFPLRVIGANSIAAYVMAHLFDNFIIQSFKTHLGPDVFKTWGTPYETLASGTAILAMGGVAILIFLVAVLQILSLKAPELP